MKGTFIIISSLAIVAAVHAAVIEGGTGSPIKKDTSQLIKQIEQPFVTRITELKQVHDELRSQVQVANDDARTHHEQEVSQGLLVEDQPINAELRRLFLYKQGATYANDNLWDRIKELGRKIAETSQEIANNIKEQAIATSDAAREKLVSAKEQLLRKLTALKDELLLRLRETLIPDDDLPLN